MTIPRASNIGFAILAAGLLAGCGLRTINKSDLEFYRSAALSSRPITKVAIYEFGAREQERLDAFSGGDQAASLAAEKRRAASLTSELFHNHFTAAFMERNVTVVERQRVLELIREQLLANRRFADLTDLEKAVSVGNMLDCDLVLYGEPLMNSSGFMFETNFLGDLLTVLPIPLLLPYPFTVLPEKQNLRIAQREGSLGSTETSFHNIWMQLYQGVSVRAVDVQTGELAYLGVMMRFQQKLLADDEIASISYLTGMEHLSKDMVDNLLTGKGM